MTTNTTPTQDQVDQVMAWAGCEKATQRPRSGGAVFCRTHSSYWWFDQGANGCKVAFETAQREAAEAATPAEPSHSDDTCNCTDPWCQA